MLAGELPIVSVVTVMRQCAPFVEPFVAQLRVQRTRNFRFGTINVVHDGTAELTDPHLRDFARWSPVRLLPEVAADSAIEDIESKALQWARIANQGVESALAEQCTHLLWIEADLCFPLDLIEQLIEDELDIVAPYIGIGLSFYDSWGFRDLEGRKIYSFNQSAVGLQRLPVELSSVGSCVLFRADIFRQGVRFRGPYDTGLLVGVCNDARALGYRVWLKPSVSILHPTTLWREQTWEVVQVVVVDGGKQVVAINLQNINVPGFYFNFIVEMLQNLPEIVARIGVGFFDLLVERNGRDRTLRLEFSRVGEAGAESLTIRQCRQVTKSVPRQD